MDYQVAFDVAEVGFRGWIVSAVGLGAAAFAALCLLFRDAVSELGLFRISKFRLHAAIALCVVFSTVFFFSSLIGYRSNTEALRSGWVDVVEGKVHSFIPKTSEARGAPPESFCVEATCFEYSGFGPLHAFGQTSLQNGPIRSGLQVRVFSLKGKILRLEIAPDDTGR